MIVTREQLASMVPLNAMVNQGEINVSYDTAINTLFADVLGAECLKELHTASLPLDEKWVNLKKDVIEGGGGLDRAICWATYLVWLQVFGKDSVTTKGVHKRSGGDDSENSDNESVSYKINNAKSNFEKFSALTRKYLVDNLSAYSCLPENNENNLEPCIIEKNKLHLGFDVI